MGNQLPHVLAFKDKFSIAHTTNYRRVLQSILSLVGRVGENALVGSEFNSNKA